MKKILIILAILIGYCATSSAQSPQPVKWRITARLTSADAGIISIKAKIEPGWQLYSTDIPEGGPIATSFDFSGSDGIEITGAITPSTKAITKHDEAFGLALGYWVNNITFSAPFKLTGKRSQAKANCTIKFMSCNGENCLPPQKTQISSAVLQAKKSEK